MVGKLQSNCQHILIKLYDHQEVTDLGEEKCNTVKKEDVIANEWKATK